VPELVILGTAASVPDATHDTVALVLRGADWAVLVDCGGSPLHKLARFGVKREQIRSVILTHRHADHLYGLPILVQGLWLSGRQASLSVHGPEDALAVARDLLELFNLAEREGMFPLAWHPIPRRERAQVLQAGDVRITATPVVHGSWDTRALRFDNLASGRSIVYSADTEPCQALIDLAVGADLLIHEATGEHEGHSSPADAADVAREAGVPRLVLIHYPVVGVDLERWRAAADGCGCQATLAQDGEVFSL
jgi:ribonuclease Z